MEKPGLPALNPSLPPPFMLTLTLMLLVWLLMLPRGLTAAEEPCKLPCEVVPLDESEVSN